MTGEELSTLAKICSAIESGTNPNDCKQIISQLIESIEKRIISNL